MFLRGSRVGSPQGPAIAHYFGHLSLTMKLYVIHIKRPAININESLCQGIHSNQWLFCPKEKRRAAITIAVQFERNPPVAFGVLAKP